VGDVSHFDLVDHDRLPTERCHYRLRKQTKFSEFKEEVRDAPCFRCEMRI
jgi:ubiquitin carboxyl-terminal hydrolase 7